MASAKRVEPVRRKFLSPTPTSLFSTKQVVVFEGDAAGDRWWYAWRLFTDRQFRHCYHARLTPAGGWLLTVSSHNDVWTEYWHEFESDPEIPPYWPNRPVRIVEIERSAPGLGFMYRGLGNCVSLTKWLLGCRAWWVVTPKQLYRHLLAKGGKEVFAINVSKTSEEVRCRKTG
jgi:hypothetical protein